MELVDRGCTFLGLLLRIAKLPSKKSVLIYIPHSAMSKCLFLGIFEFFLKSINLMSEKHYLIVVVELLFKPGKQEFNKSNSCILKMKIPGPEILANSSN